MRARIGHFAFALLGIVALLLVIQFLPVPRRTHFWDRFYDTGHILIFGLITVLLLHSLMAVARDRLLLWQYLVAMTTALGMGIGLEIWQAHHNRTAEWIDGFNDVVGILAFASAFAIFDRRIAEPRQGILNRSRLASIVIALLVIGAVPMLNTVEVYSARRHLLPRLVDFRQPWEEVFYYTRSADFERVESPVPWPNDDAGVRRVVGKLTLHPGHKPGFFMYEPYPDWRGYETLVVELFHTAAETQKFSLLVHDVHHNHRYDDRFNLDLQLKPGFQRIVIPLSDIQRAPHARQMDMSQIAGFRLFAVDLDQSVELYLGELRLSH